MEKSKTQYPKAKPQKIKYFNLEDQDGIFDIIASACRYKLPVGGIHTATLWKNRDTWGLFFQILARNKKFDDQDEKKTRSTKAIYMQMKWKSKNPVLVPTQGYEDFLKTIDIKETKLIKDKLEANNSEEEESLSKLSVENLASEDITL